MGAESEETDFLARRARWYARANSEFCAWFEGLSSQEQSFLRNNGICDFESRLDPQSLDACDDDSDTCLELRAAHVRYPNGQHDFEKEILAVLDPQLPSDLPTHCCETVQDIVSSVAAELLFLPTDDMLASLLALCLATGWGEADGLSVEVATQRGKTSPRAIGAQTTRWKQLLSLQELPREILSKIHIVLDHVMSAGNVNTSLVALVIASGLGTRCGNTVSSIAKRCGCSRQNISKEVVQWRERLGLPPLLGGGKSIKAREEFRKAQLEGSWWREPIRLAAQIDSELKK